MQNKKTVHLIPHTHWDREWYYSSVNSKIMCYWSMKYMIEYLIKNPEAKFLYDGQTSVVEDFLEFAPDWKEKMKKVIKSKQLMVGPWYTQTDNLQPIGESIIRNLEIGQKI
ncbi:polysaccharide deacetylase family protein, partial [Mycoplasma marinum]